MGHVIKNGPDALGTGRSYYLDKDFQAEVQTMMDLGKVLAPSHVRKSTSMPSNCGLKGVFQLINNINV